MSFTATTWAHSSARPVDQRTTTPMSTASRAAWSTSTGSRKRQESGFSRRRRPATCATWSLSWRGLQIAAGAGAEISSHDTEFVTRLGAAYQFPIGERFTIAPNFNTDLVDGDPTYIYGITFGVGFLRIDCQAER